VARTTLPTVTLMHPTLVSTPFHREGLIFEEKVDGYRMVAYKADRSVKLTSRQGVGPHLTLPGHCGRAPGARAAVP